MPVGRSSSSRAIGPSRSPWHSTMSWSPPCGGRAARPADVMDFSRIAIVNRGEPAMRAVLAIQELALELPADLRSIALYTDPDEQAMFVREADERYGLGAATFVDP